LSRSRRSGRREARPSIQLTSQPTSRNAYVETRQWLLARHGPVCAYCERRVRESDITLDHVSPRKGRDAYDRRDNLLLSCTTCNNRKADTPILLFLMQRRERAVGMLRYGEHLSPMLQQMARELVGEEMAARIERLRDPDYPYAD
jgi:5-methylcytosine-specific restriction endonuclease McrA